MALKYRITKRRNNIKNTDEPQYIMQAVSKGVIDLEKICRDISNSCTIKESDVVGVVSALGHNLRDHLEQGYTVDLGDLGRFKLGLKVMHSPTRNCLPQRVSKNLCSITSVPNALKTP